MALRLSNASGAAAGPVPFHALWAAESDGVHRLSPLDGSVSWSEPSEQPVRAVAVDLNRLQVWACSDSTLLLFGPGGELLLEAPVPGPSPAEVLLEIDPRDGSVWIGGRRDLWRVSTSGEVLAEVRLEREARALGMDVESSLLRVATGRSVLALDPVDGTVRSEIDFGPKAGVADIERTTNGTWWVAVDGSARTLDSGTGPVWVDLDEKILHLAAAADGSLYRMIRGAGGCR